MAVPFIDLKRFEPDFLGRWADKCAHVTRNTMFVGGPEVAELERRLKEITGAFGVVGCANGTDALQLALRAAGVGPGDVVLIPDSTFWATFEAVVNVAAKPVTVDINLGDLQMDFHRFAEAVEKYRPKAAILVHLYGWGSARLKDFRRFCKERNVLLIEDGAQCYGVTLDGEDLYKGAYLATTSFYPAKVLGSCGDAGAVFCSTKALEDTVRRLGNHGRSAHYGHSEVGWNSRLAGFDAAYLNLSLDYMEARLESRRRMSALYRERLTALGVRVIGPPAGYVENGYLNVVLLPPDKRSAVEAVLKAKGIGFGNVYPDAMSLQPGAQAYLHGQVGSENAIHLSKSVLNLPLYAYMKEAELEEVLAAFAEGLKAAGLELVASQ